MDPVEQEILRAKEAPAGACLATVVSATGSVPMSRRARMLVRADGATVGTVGGGRLEAAVQAAARQVIAEGRARLVRHTLTAKDAGDSGMVCGGSVEIFLEPLTPETIALTARLAALRGKRERAAVAVVLEAASGAGARPGDRLVIPERGPVQGSLAEPRLRAILQGAAPKTWRQETPRCLALARGSERLEEEPTASAEVEARFFLDPVLPSPTLFVFGGGHVGLYTAQLGALVGMRVVVVDDRPEFANPERFPWASETIVTPFDRVFERVSLDEFSYVVSVTRGHEYDEVVVAHALRSPARYVGMIGSRRKVRLIKDRLRQMGLTDEALARLRAPIGLDIHADTPEEIAVSIIAEVIAVRRGVEATAEQTA